MRNKKTVTRRGRVDGRSESGVPARLEREALVQRVMRFIRSLLVGGAATLVDFIVLEIAVRLLSIEATRAKIPALAAGALTQFIGSRTFAFRAQAGNLTRQAVLFMAAELATLTMNWLVFRTLLRFVHLRLEVANFLGTFLVFVFFSYPIWRIVFRVPPAEAAVCAAPEAAAAEAVSQSEAATERDEVGRAA